MRALVLQLWKMIQKTVETMFSHLNESAILNAFILKSEAFLTHHTQVGQNKRYFFHFNWIYLISLLEDFKEVPGLSSKL